MTSPCVARKFRRVAHENVLHLNLEMSPPADSVAMHGKNTKAQYKNHSRRSAITLSLMLVIMSLFRCSSPPSDGAHAHNATGAGDLSALFSFD